MVRIRSFRLLPTIVAVAVCGPIVIGIVDAQQPRPRSVVPAWDVVSIKPCVSNMAE